MLICVSEVTAARLRACCEVRAPVVVAPHGVDHERFTPLEPSAGADRAACPSLGVPPDRPLVVFVGTLEPRKGVAPLVAAFDRVAERSRGRAGAGRADRLGNGRDRAGPGRRPHGDRIIRTGYLPDEAVPALLRQATVVAYPALEEGFGLPALEALACGAPLITTEGTAMAEMAGGAALLVPPGDVDQLADALGAALDEGRARRPGRDARARRGGGSTPGRPASPAPPGLSVALRASQ